MALDIFAFSPAGLTVSFLGATTAPTAVQPISSAAATRPVYQYRFVNAGTETVLLGAGSTAGAAQTRAVSIAAGAVPLVPGAVEVLGFPTASFFSGTTASGTSLVYITPGEGL